MAKRITAEIKQQMLELYHELGTYSAVAKQLGISASTVSRYIKEQQNTKTYISCIAAKPIEEITKESLLTFSNLTEQEKESYQNWIKEFR